MQIAVQTLILHSRERMNEHYLKVRLSKDDCFKITAEYRTIWISEHQSLI